MHTEQNATRESRNGEPRTAEYLPPHIEKTAKLAEVTGESKVTGGSG